MITEMSSHAPDFEEVFAQCFPNIAYNHSPLAVSPPEGYFLKLLAMLAHYLYASCEAHKRSMVYVLNLWLYG